jgi:hypothetical protein
MCLTARNLLISLLILAQGLVLWQGAFAAGLIQLNAVDTENPVHCHQTPVSEQSQLNAIQTDITEDSQDCCDKDCGEFCQCNECACSIGLICSSLAINFSITVLNCTAFPTIIDGPKAQLFKPPRKFHR